MVVDPAPTLTNEKAFTIYKVGVVGGTSVPLLYIPKLEKSFKTGTGALAFIEE